MSKNATRKRGKSGTRKYDRNRAWCQAYRGRGQRERNKAARLDRHLRRLPNDACAARALARARG